MTTSPMPKPAQPTPAMPAAGARAKPFELAVMAAVVVVDQLTKWIVRRTLLEGESRNLIPGFLDLTHVHNTGAAFGLLNGADFAGKPYVMIGIAALALVAIATYANQLGFHERMARIGLVLILGGAFGNLIDRAITGHVVDFVDVYWGEAHFWAFNVADAAITIGVVIILARALFMREKPPAPHGPEANDRQADLPAENS